MIKSDIFHPDLWQVQTQSEYFNHRCRLHLLTNTSAQARIIWLIFTLGLIHIVPILEKVLDYINSKPGEF